MNQFTLLGLIPIVLWGMSLPIMKLSLEQFGTWWTLVFFSLGGPLLLVLQLVFNYVGFILLLKSVQPKIVLIRLALFIGHFVILFSCLNAVNRAQVPIIIFFQYLWPTFTLWFGLYLFKQPYRHHVL